MEHISDIVRRVIASLEKDAVIQTTGEPDGRPYLGKYEDYDEYMDAKYIADNDDYRDNEEKEEAE